MHLLKLRFGLAILLTTTGASADPGGGVTAPPPSAEEAAGDLRPDVPPQTDAAPEPDAEEAESDETSGWFRIDTDALQTQFWFGATHSVGSFDLASDIYVVGSFAELDFGPTFSVGNVSITPMVGVGFDFSAGRVAALVAPQVFTIYDGDLLYGESWAQLFVSSPFADGAENLAYARNFLLYKVSAQLHFGPQVELSYRLNGTMDESGPGISSLPLGARANLSYGKKNTLGIFLAGETQDPGVAGRFTFVRTW